ncbi:MAG TPA: VOC family protein, partial [Dehalococcoidia bacterium]|nr:VOC family protein [Dehalococcoidia bacterium]
MTATQNATSAVRPAGVSHLVLNVRNLEESEHFWTQIMGFERVGELKHGMKMRFYRGGTPGHHHDLALNEVANPPDSGPAEWSMAG